MKNKAVPFAKNSKRSASFSSSNLQKGCTTNWCLYSIALVSMSAGVAKLWYSSSFPLLEVNSISFYKLFMNKRRHCTLNIIEISSTKEQNQKALYCYDDQLFYCRTIVVPLHSCSIPFNSVRQYFDCLIATSLTIPAFLLYELEGGIKYWLLWCALNCGDVQCCHIQYYSYSR